MKLDNNQLKAVKAKEKNILVVAAPGSGKTTVIINRIYNLIKDREAKIGNIIVITFTKSAALNMKNRYISTFKQSNAPFFGTFHGLFYKILLREGKQINIIEGYKTHKLLERVLKKYFDEINDDKIKEVLNNISLYKTSKDTLDEFKSTLTKDIFLECLEVYEGYKKENNFWDFDDLAIEAINMLKNNSRLLESYRGIFKYMLVDEFQDCDELQVEFLKLINEGKDNTLFAVGDEDQCIYSFRGSKPEYMVTFDKIFKKAKKYYLNTNYRSSKNIIELSKDIISKNLERNKKDIIWNKESNGIISYSKSYDEKLQGEHIVRTIRYNVETGNYNYKENIILYRTNMESMSVVDSLIRNKIPFTLLDREYNFFDHFICKDLISYLKLAQNPYDKDAFINIINKPFRYMSKLNIEYVRKYKEERNLFDILIEKDDTPPFQRKKLDELKCDVNNLKKATLGSAIQYIISDLGYIDYLKTFSEKFNQSMDDLEDIVEEFKISASGFNSISTFFAHIEEVKRELEESKGKKDEDRVLLSTIHGVKGMEFKNVFLINCNEDTMPHASSKEENIEEERRLFYVGITRAIDNLFLYSPKTRKGKFKDVSRFITEGGLDKENGSIHGLTKNMDVHHKTYGQGIIAEVNGDEVKIKFEDKITRKFSGAILVNNSLIIVIK